MKQSKLIWLCFLLGSLPAMSQSQYFGQNKPRYTAFNFQVLQSPHFELYHYFKDPAVSKEILINSEHWYNLHQEVFKLAFVNPNPLIMYKTHPHFQETTAIGGNIGEGTGGVTEGLRNRVVMPVMFSKRQTDHVLGHELVHAFQYQSMTAGSDSISLQNIGNIPLFMVEGLAEYMSLGREDSHTAMWMRDAVLSGDIPTIEDLVTKQNKYFPYRWGQAFWSYVTSTYGDDIIRPLFRETAQYGIQAAFQRAFKMDLARFSVRFKNALIEQYSPLKEGRDTKTIGRVLASEKNAGEMNISPAISPDGKYVAYISSKNVLSLDIFIVEVATGKVIRTIKGDSFAGHIDSFSFIETSGTWSPDSRNFGIVIQSRGTNRLLVLDVQGGGRRQYTINGVEAFAHPAWSPDGRSVVVTGQRDGQSDLYRLELNSGTVTPLTSDIYSDFHPAWSPDGQFVYFVSDRSGQNKRLEKEHFTVARINVQTKQVENFTVFPKSDHMNPVVGKDPNTFYFISDQDGFRNIYSYATDTRTARQLTNYYTGVSGITMYSPAISISHQTNQLVYNHFQNGDYTIATVNVDEFSSKQPTNSDRERAGTLPFPAYKGGRNIVERNLGIPSLRVPSELTFTPKKYDARFKLDYLANSGLGVSTSQFGTGMGGGVTALFSDMLNNNQLAGTVALNGEIQDFGGQFFYLNQKRPFQWGVSASHVPIQFFGGTNIKTLDTLGTAGGLTYYDARVSQRIFRMFIEDASLFAYRPVSRYQRFEGGASLRYYWFSLREYPQVGRMAVGPQGYIYDFRPYGAERPRNVRDEVTGFNPFSLNHLYGAYVGDNATFGLTAPLNGYRYRFEAGQYIGANGFTNINLDYRRYKYLKPFSLAVRGMYIGRLNATNLQFINSINPLYIGFPWYMHGFFGNAFNKVVAATGNQNLQRQLQGNQIAVGNFEVRLPLLGPKKLALIDFQYAPADLNLFFDTGMAWSDSKLRINREQTFVNGLGNTQTYTVSPVISTGISLRVNVLGYLIVEPYLAKTRLDGKWNNFVTGMNFMVPGW